VVTPNVRCSYVQLIRRIIEGKRNNKNRKKRNTRTTDFEAIAHYCTYYYHCISVIHLHTFLFVLNRILDGNVLWNVSFHPTIMVICVYFTWALNPLLFNISFYLAALTLCL